MNKVSREDVGDVVDGLLKFIAAGGFITTSLIFPGAGQVFEKPLDMLFKGFDERSRKREMARLVYYMKQRGLIAYRSRDYEHGIEITKKGQRRLKDRTYSKLAIPVPEKWDKKWRLVFFDIPYEASNNRNSLTFKLKQLGYQTLQKSVWVHPFPSKQEIEVVSERLGLRKYITYVEIDKIDADGKLRKRFQKLLAKTSY